MSNATRRWDPLGALGLCLLVALWFALVPLVPRSLLPTPQGAVSTLFSNFFFAPSFRYFGTADQGFFSALMYTMQNVFIAVALGGSVGLVSGLSSARLPRLRAALDPVAVTVGTVPIVIAAPFLLLWFGTGRMISILMVSFYVSVILYIYAQRAADNLDSVYEDAARTMGATPGRIIRELLLPGTLPEILGGFRIALAGSWGLEAIAELLGGQRGIGKLIESIVRASDVRSLFAGLLLLGFTAIIVDLLFGMLIRALTRWRPLHAVE